ncbi:ABC transporter substrate-binding protein [Butyrivibrio sp. NC2002]|uniref:ABC transporter substrate-binding protein n=1 Tax=Butyrivibrio sp. NC2002 TaxID=1410610 RepID=UPI000561E98B|nr:ABC transporter substrate-binding protein [Butyrivibrio sp. NC2002]
MKRKVISTLMATAMTMSMLAGCGSSTGTETATDTQETEAAEETTEEASTEEASTEEASTEEATEETTEESADESAEAASGDATTINVYRCTFNLANPDSEQVQKVEDAINAYIADKIPVQIKLTDVGSGEYTDKANLALANNEINLLWTASWEGTIGTNDLVPANAVYDLSDILPGTDLYNSMDEGQWEAAKYDGKMYFIPVYKDNVEGYDFMFRQDLIDKHNWDITSVKELKDLEPMLEDAKADGLKYPFLTQKTAMFYRWYIDKFDFFTADSATNFVAVDRATDEVVDTILTPEYKEFCTLMGEWADKGYISEDDYTKVTTDTTTQTQDWAVSWWTDIPVNDEADARYGQDVTMQPATDRWAHSTSALGSCYCVTANSTEEQAKACVDFLGLLYTDSKLADMYTFGIEGEDFTYDSNGQVTQTSEKYNHSMWESASATIVTPLDNEPANKAELYKDFNGGANTSSAAGFRFDKSPVEDKYAACANVSGEYGFNLENGGVPAADVESTIEAYQAALDEAGYQDVLAEFQKQYDEWKASK